jgi:gliding motility-associated-like protein
MYLTFPNMKLPGKIIITVLLCIGSIMGHSQVDTQFWFAAPDLQQAHGDRPILLRMAASKLPATVTISIPANPGFNPINISIAANSSQSVDLTAFIGLIENTLPNAVYQKGLLISSTSPIACYYDIAHPNNGDMYALKGKNALGKKFTIPLQMDFNNRTAVNTPYTTDFIIVATEDNTSITISPKNALVGRAGPFTIVLSRGETYVCTSTSTIGTSKPGGTIVTSNKPIAISTKDDSITLPGQPCSDTAGDQLLPDDLAGNEFIVVKGYLSTSPDHYYVYATSNATTIKINGLSVGTINAGEFYTGKLTDISCYIESDKPTHVFHVTGFGCELGGAVIPPIRCTGSTSVNVTRATSTEAFYVNVISPSDIINSFTLNGSNTLIDATVFQAIPGSGGKWMASRITVPTNVASAGQTVTIDNPKGKFHVGIIHGSPSSTTRYGFFSDFSSNTIVLKNAEDSTKDLSDSTTLCNNITAKINARNFSADTYRWTGPNGFTSDSSMLIINPYRAKDTGLYTITTSGAGCGTASDSIRLFIDQPVADFQFNTNGCAQDGVAFTTPASAGVRWVWDFGNGKKLDTNSVLIPPVVLGLTGDIPVKLKVGSARGCFSDEVSKTVRLSSKPVPAYTIPNITCINTDIVFKDASTIQSGSIVKWRWNLDNGAGFKEYTDNGDRVSPYTSFGTKNVRLVTESQTGCVSDTFRLNSFVVNPLPVPGFIIPEVCLDDAKAVFIDSTKSPDGYTGFSYKWAFNAGTPPVANGPTFTVANTTEKNPSVKYNATGQYLVKLVVESRGCIDSISQSFKVYGTNPTPAFDVLAPDSLCGNDSVRIVNRSTIDFDNVTRLEIYWDENNPALKTIDETPFIGKVYAFKYTDFQSPMTKTFNVTLRAFSGTASSCSKAITKQIKINASPKVAFSPVPGICLDAAPRQVTQASFDPIVPGAFVFSGKGVSATGMVDPAVAGVGTHAIKYLYSSSASVCKDSASRNITVWPLPTANFTVSTLNCEKNPISFTSTAATAVGKLAKWAWNFGDATPVVNALTGAVVSHTFSVYKKYDVSLVVTSDSGCVSLAKTIPLDVFALPRPVFDLPNVCLPEGKALFNNSTTIPDGTDNLLTYRWNFGDPRNTNPSVVKNGIHNYSAVGPYNVKLIATSTNNCKDSLVRQLVTVYEQPKARFASEDSLCIGDLLHCADSSKTNNGIFNKWFWNFGDGATDILKNPVHRYTTAAIQTITFFAQTDLGCYTDTIKKQLEVFAYPVISAGPDLFVLDDGQKQIKATATGRIVSYTWTPSTYLSDTSILQPTIIKPQDDIYYYLAVKGRGACISKDTLFVVSLTMPKPPNTFTPNGDGINDTWEIKYLDQYEGCVVEIYSATGQLLFRNTGYVEPWNGSYKGQAVPAGTYYFVIDPKNGRKKIAGYLTILR